MKDVDIRKKAFRKANEIERKHGSAALCKICINIVNKILVEEGITTNGILRKKFLDEIKYYEGL